jgi:hypothetical protein
MVCLGSDKAERSSQPRLVALSIVPDYLRELTSFALPKIAFAIYRNGLTPFLWDRTLTVAPSIFISKSNGQLNTLQTIVLVSHSFGSNAVKALR